MSEFDLGNTPLTFDIELSEIATSLDTLRTRNVNKTTYCSSERSACPPRRMEGIDANVVHFCDVITTMNIPRSVCGKTIL